MEGRKGDDHKMTVMNTPRKEITHQGSDSYINLREAELPSLFEFEVDDSRHNFKMLLLLPFSSVILGLPQTELSLGLI